jgi:hypothetical protein
LGRAFNPSVLFMMAMPFLVFGAIAGGLVYAYRRAQKNTDKLHTRGQTANADVAGIHGQQEQKSEHEIVKITSTQNTTKSQRII